MTPEQFSALVDAHGGATKVALLLGISQAQVSQYATGRRNMGGKMLKRVEALTNANKPESNATYTSDEIVYGARQIWIDYYTEKVNAGVGVPLDSPTKFRREVDAALIKNPKRAFCVFTHGDSMNKIGIMDGSFLICEHVNGDVYSLVGEVVIANVNDVTLVKRLILEDGKYILRSESWSKYKDIELNESTQGVIQGVVLSWHTDSKPYKVKP